MSRDVCSFMNPALVYVLEDDIERARDLMIRFEVTTIPVLDEEQIPVGIISLRGLDRSGRVMRVSRPVLTVSTSDDIEHAARVLAESDFHHLVVVDDSGRAVGMISAIDLLRALEHLPKRTAPFDAYCTYSEEAS